MVEIYKNIEDYNADTKSSFDDMMADVLSNVKLSNLIVTELFFRVRKLNISLAFITQSYQIVHIILFWKLQINANLKKLHPKILQILTSKLYESLQKIYRKNIFLVSYW